jgi:hypothetical protein
MKAVLDLILLTVIICFIVDCSGFFSFIKKFIASRLEGKYKNLKAEDIKIPFITCSLCSVWWSGLIYLLFTHNFIIPYIAFVAFLSLISSNISGFLLTIKDYLATFENWLQKLIQN